VSTAFVARVFGDLWDVSESSQCSGSRDVWVASVRDVSPRLELEVIGDLFVELVVPGREEILRAFAKGVEPGHQPSCAAARSTRSMPLDDFRHHSISASSRRCPDAVMR
jgi:hypothetical protein